MGARLALAVAAVLALAPATAAGAAPDGTFDWPLRGTPVVDRAFDPPATAWGRGHRGVDLRAPRGEPVLASGAGRVSHAGLLAGRGVVTVVHDGGLRTTYEPVEAVVRVGQRVRVGAVLGRLGSGHASCRPRTTCLHWGLLRGRTYLDPLALVHPGPARLLPLGDLRPSAVDGREPPHSEHPNRGATRPSRDGADAGAPALPGPAAAVLALAGGGALLARRRT